MKADAFAENRMVESHPQIPSAIPEKQTAHNRQYVRLTGSAYVPLWAGYFDVPYVESGFGLGVTKVVVY